MTSIERQSQLLKRGEAIRKLPVQPTDAFEAGEMVERERIIKLLEVLNICDCDPDDGQAKHYRCGASQGLTPSEVIALIKGENK